jgi:hypothetical protein
MKTKSLEERYGDEILTDNTALDKCRQCKDCLFWNDGTVYSNNYQKGSCAIYGYPDSKPIDVMLNKEKCEYYEKEE